MRWLCLFIFLIPFSLAFSQSDDKSAQTDTKQFKFPDAVGAQMEYGFVLPHRPHMKSLIKGHSPAFRVHAEWRASGFKDWHQLYLGPSMGVEYQYIDLGNPEQLGSSHALFYYLRLPIKNQRNHSSQIRMGIGAGYLSKKYDIRENGKNLAAGSHINGAVFIHYQHSIHLGKNIWLNPGIGLTHFSNAAYQVPNLGLNIAAVHLGLAWMSDQFRDEPATFDAVIQSAKPENRWVTYGAFGLNENFPPGGPKYGAYNMGMEYDKSLGYKSALSLRADLYYSEAVHAELLDRNEGDSPRSDALQAGLAVGYGLYFGRMLVQLQTGYYLLDTFGKNGSIYNRFTLQQQVSEHLIIAAGLKTHFAKAQNFEIGLGWKW